MKKSILYVLLLAFFAVNFTSCKPEKKDTGDKIEETMEDAGDAVEDAADDAGDAVEDAADRVKDATE